MPTFIEMDFSGVPIHDGTTLDYPTAWAIQKSVGASLDHHPRCSSVPGWDAISGPGLLCDCGAVELEWTRQQERRADLPLLVRVTRADRMKVAELLKRETE